MSEIIQPKTISLGEDHKYKEVLSPDSHLYHDLILHHPSNRFDKYICVYLYKLCIEIFQLIDKNDKTSEIPEDFRMAFDDILSRLSVSENSSSFSLPVTKKEFGDSSTSKQKFIEHVIDLSNEEILYNDQTNMSQELILSYIKLFINLKLSYCAYNFALMYLVKQHMNNDQNIVNKNFPYWLDDVINLCLEKPWYFNNAQNIYSGWENYSSDDEDTLWSSNDKGDHLGKLVYDTPSKPIVGKSSILKAKSISDPNFENSKGYSVNESTSEYGDNINADYKTPLNEAKRRVRFKLGPNHVSEEMENLLGGRSNKRRFRDFACRRNQVMFSDCDSPSISDSYLLRFLLLLSNLFLTPCRPINSQQSDQIVQRLVIKVIVDVALCSFLVMGLYKGFNLLVAHL